MELSSERAPHPNGRMYVCMYVTLKSVDCESHSALERELELSDVLSRFHSILFIANIAIREGRILVWNCMKLVTGIFAKAGLAFAKAEMSFI